MFTDVRSKKIVLVAHCVLNQNAIADGTADFAGTDEAVVRRLLEAGIGILQLPCPELNCLGLDRGDPKGGERPLLEENSRIREAMGHTAPARILASLVEQVVYQIANVASAVMWRAGGQPLLGAASGSGLRHIIF
jgi:hypothetical protein